MDLLDNIMSDMKDGKPKGQGKPRPTPPTAPSGSTQFARIPKKSHANVPTNEGEGCSSRPPAVFNKRPLDANNGYPDAKREKLTETFNTVNSAPIQVNQYELKLDRLPEIVERFHVEVYVMNSKQKTIQVNGETTVHGDLAKQYRLWGLWNVWTSAIKNNTQLFEGDMRYCLGVYDCGASAYFPYGMFKGGQETTLTLNKENFNKDEWKAVGKLMKSDILSINFQIVRNKNEGLIYTRNIESLPQENLNELVRFLEALTSQKTFADKYFQFGNTTFMLSSDTDRNCQIDMEGKEIKTGFEKALRVVTKPDGLPRIVMTIDTRRSPFYQKMDVLEMLKLIYNVGSGRNNGGNRYGRDNHGRGDGRDNNYGRGDRDRGYGRDDRGHRRDDRSYGRNDRSYGRDDRGYGRDDRSYGRDDRDDRDRHGRYDRDREDGRNHGKNEIDPDILNIVSMMERDGERKTNVRLSELKSLAVRPTHLSESKLNLFFINSFVYKSAHDLKFVKDKEGNEISVFEYFIEKYNYTIKYPDLPMAAQKRGSNIACYPLELLKIEEGQRVKQNNITPKIQQEMTGKLSLLPLQHIAKAREVLENHLKVNDNEFLKSFGLFIDSNPIEMVAKVLPAPIIRFAQRCTEQPETGTFRKPTLGSGRGKFIQPANLNEILIINFDRAIDRASHGYFCKGISSACYNQGIKIAASPDRWRIIDCDETDHQLLEDTMIDAKKNNVSLVLAVTNESRPDVHDVIKLFENQIGVQTQHISKKTANVFINTSGGKQTSDNVIRKLNLKCGGLNFSVSVPRNINSRTICENDERVRKMFFDNTLFIGFELSHAGATCLFDNQNNITCGEPSVVGYSYSYGDACELGGASYLQKAREHSIMYLTKHMGMILSNYLSSKKALPEKIVVYRSGTGEGDFEKVVNEVNQMRSVFLNDERFKGKIPQFLMIVVSKTSHMRIYPKDIKFGKSAEQNVLSGTCVAGGITSFGREEFYLVSQSAIIGTVRPARYTILVNEPKWTVNEVTHLSYFLAYGHQVSYQPPGVPHILYAAENMAKRGQNNFKAHQKLMRLRPNNEGYAVGEDNESGEMMEALSAKLNKCAIKCKNFWA